MFSRGGNARKRGVDAALSRSGSGFRGGSGIVFACGDFRENERGDAAEAAGGHRPLLRFFFGFDGAQQRLRVRRRQRAFRGKSFDHSPSTFFAMRGSRVGELRERAPAPFVGEVVPLASSFAEAGDERDDVESGAAGTAAQMFLRGVDAAKNA